MPIFATDSKGNSERQCRLVRKARGAWRTPDSLVGDIQPQECFFGSFGVNVGERPIRNLLALPRSWNTLKSVIAHRNGNLYNRSGCHTKLAAGAFALAARAGFFGSISERALLNKDRTLEGYLSPRRWFVKFTRIVVTHYGGPDALQVVEDQCPEPQQGEVRVRVLAAGVAMPDIMAREGIHPETPRAPFTPGWDL